MADERQAATMSADPHRRLMGQLVEAWKRDQDLHEDVRLLRTYIEANSPGARIDARVLACIHSCGQLLVELTRIQITVTTMEKP